MALTFRESHPVVRRLDFFLKQLGIAITLCYHIGSVTRDSFWHRRTLTSKPQPDASVCGSMEPQLPYPNLKNQEGDSNSHFTLYFTCVFCQLNYLDLLSSLYLYEQNNLQKIFRLVSLRTGFQPAYLPLHEVALAMSYRSPCVWVDSNHQFHLYPRSINIRLHTHLKILACYWI